MYKREVDLFQRLHSEDYLFFRNVCEAQADLLRLPVPGGVAIANLLLHVAEMERFWIDWGLNGQPFERKREDAFTDEVLGPSEIDAILKDRNEKTVRVIQSQPSETWEKVREFHGDQLTGLNILQWHQRHLGMHRGQILSHLRWLNR